MSFSNNPYKNFELHKLENGHSALHCESCGWDSDSRSPFRTFKDTTTILEIWKVWYFHLDKSHHLKPSDTEQWGDY